MDKWFKYMSAYIRFQFNSNIGFKSNIDFNSKS
jgi:hypothetical protein